MKATIKQNRFGNWNGYLGGKRVIEFAQDVAGPLVGASSYADTTGAGSEPPEAATKWLAAQQDFSGSVKGVATKDAGMTPCGAGDVALSYRKPQPDLPTGVKPTTELFPDGSTIDTDPVTGNRTVVGAQAHQEFLRRLREEQQQNKTNEERLSLLHHFITRYKG